MEKVLIGTFDARTKQDQLRIDERLELAKRLEAYGIPFQFVKSEWPRDCFVNFNGQVYTRKKHGFYADGGYILPNSALTFACTSVSQKEDGGIDSPELRIKKLRALYGNIQLMPAPNPALNKFTSPHIDLVLLPLIEKGVLFVDRDYFQENKQDVEDASSEHGLKVELVTQDYVNPNWACNTLVVKRERETIAVTNENSHTLISRLADLGVKIISAPFSHNCAVGGSISCATNTIPENYKGIEKFLF